MSLTEDKDIQLSGQACKAHDYDLMKPVVLASWKHGFQGSWSDKSAVLAESQVNSEICVFDVLKFYFFQLLYLNVHTLMSVLFFSI